MRYTSVSSIFTGGENALWAILNQLPKRMALIWNISPTNTSSENLACSSISRISLLLTVLHSSIKIMSRLIGRVLPLRNFFMVENSALGAVTLRRRLSTAGFVLAR